MTGYLPLDHDTLPPSTVCPTCRRIVVRPAGHRCNVLRDYQWMGNHR
jgi:hypothetical protein